MFGLGKKKNNPPALSIATGPTALTEEAPKAPVVIVTVNPERVVGDEIKEISNLVAELPKAHEANPEAAFDKLGTWVADAEIAYNTEAAGIVRLQLDAGKVEEVDESQAVLDQNARVRATLTTICEGKAEEWAVKDEELGKDKQEMRKYKLRMAGMPDAIIAPPNPNEERDKAIAVFLIATALEVGVNYLALQGKTSLLTSVIFGIGAAIVASFAAHKAGYFKRLIAAYNTAVQRAEDWKVETRRNLAKKYKNQQIDPDDPDVELLEVEVAPLDSDVEDNRKLAHRAFVGTCLIVLGIRVVSILTSRHPNWGSLAGSLIFMAIVGGYYLYKVTSPNPWRMDMMPEYKDKAAKLAALQLEVQALEVAYPEEGNSYRAKLDTTVGDYNRDIKDIETKGKDRAESAKARRATLQALRRELLSAPEYFLQGFRRFAEMLEGLFGATSGIDLADDATAHRIGRMFEDRRQKFSPDLMAELETEATRIDRKPTIKLPYIQPGEFQAIIDESWRAAKGKALEAKAKRAAEAANQKKVAAQVAAADRISGFQAGRRVPAWRRS